MNHQSQRSAEVVTGGARIIACPLHQSYGTGISGRRRGGYLRVLGSAGTCFALGLAACDPTPPDYESPLGLDNDSGSGGTTMVHDPPLPGFGGRVRSDAGGAPPALSAIMAAGTSRASGGGATGLSKSSGSGAVGSLVAQAGSPVDLAGSGAKPTSVIDGTAGSARTAANGGANGWAGSSTTSNHGKNTTPSCIGKSGLQVGKSNRSVSAAGVDRTFVQYVPPLRDPNTAVPVVIVPHGWLMTGEQMYAITRHDILADREGFIVLYPDGEPLSLGPWNVGEGACPSTLLVLPTATGDDQTFIDEMLNALESNQCIDRRHVFVTGFSMGGYFSNETGCLRKEIAAIGPHSGGSHELANCPSLRKPVILLHGTADGLIPVACGKEARDRWASLNGCGQTVESRPVKKGHCEYSQGCPADGQVALCLFDGMDHGWAGGAKESFSFPEYESAAELGWTFFKSFAW